MKNRIIGAGNVGENAAKLFAKAGSETAVANSRSPETQAFWGRKIIEIGIDN